MLGLHLGVQALEDVLVAPGARERVQGVRVSRRRRLPSKAVAADGRAGRAAVQ